MWNHGTQTLKFFTMLEFSFHFLSPFFITSYALVCFLGNANSELVVTTFDHQLGPQSISANKEKVNNVEPIRKGMMVEWCGVGCKFFELHDLVLNIRENWEENYPSLMRKADELKLGKALEISSFEKENSYFSIALFLHVANWSRSTFLDDRQHLENEHKDENCKFLKIRILNVSI